tara:strand:- start:1044 stop:1253 length:210 start_codon:yes stop_codon:yes gene_type:complete
MICEKELSNILTTIEKIKNKIELQEYLDIMKGLTNLYNTLDDEYICEECSEAITSCEDTDSCDSCDENY